MTRAGSDRQRSFISVLALLLLAAAMSGQARAQAQTADAQGGAPPAAVATAPGPRVALGASFGFVRQQDLGGVIATRFVPSLVGLAYVNLTPRLYLRPGVRLGYAGLTQPDAASDAHVEEHGLQARAEVGLLYDAWVVPAIAMGAGLERRTIDFASAGNVQDSGALDRTEWLGSLYMQAGLGVPLFRGLVVVEPYYRLHHTFADDRSSSEVGFDVTFAL